MLATVIPFQCEDFSFEWLKQREKSTCPNAISTCVKISDIGEKRNRAIASSSSELLSQVFLEQLEMRRRKSLRGYFRFSFYSCRVLLGEC